MTIVIEPINVIDESFDTSILADFRGVGALEREYKRLVAEGKIDPHKVYSQRVTDLIDKTKSFKFNFTNIDELNRKLSRKIFHNKEFRERVFSSRQKSVDYLPAYKPPSNKHLLAFKIFSEAYSANRPASSNDSSRAMPRKPHLPKAKTNTNLATYIHKIYMYEQFLKDQLKQQVLSPPDENPVMRLPTIKAKKVEDFVTEKVFSHPRTAVTFELGASSESSSSTSSADSTGCTVRLSGRTISLKHKYNPELSKSVARSISLKYQGSSEETIF